ESNAPTSNCAPSLISFSARARAVSTLDSVSASMIVSAGRLSDFSIAGATSTPRWQSWPMPASKPERGNSTPTLSGACSARRSEGAAKTAAAAAVPAKRSRRLGLKGTRSMEILPGRLLFVQSDKMLAHVPEKWKPLFREGQLPAKLPHHLIAHPQPRPVVAVARAQHQPDRQRGIRQRHRDRAKIEEIDN